MAQTAQINIKIDGQQAQDTFTNLRKSINTTRTELDGIIRKYGENSREADNQRKVLGQLEIQYDSLTKSVTDLGARFDDVHRDIQPMTTRLGELEDRLYELSLAGQQSSQEFRDLMNEAGRLRQTIILTDMSVDALAQTMSQRLLSSATGIMGIFTAAQGATALFGSENKELEKTLMKLTAAMAILQGIDAFRQNLPSIQLMGKSLLSLLPSFAGVTTASGVMSAALQSIPFVAVVSGIALAVGGLMSYISNTEKAAKEEKKRKEELEKLKKQQEELNTFIGKETGEYVGLIYQLKNTNANSVERKQLIKDINATYGTTLKNMSDEVAFQNQLNGSVREYIALQYNRFKLDKNQEYINKQMEIRFNAEQKLNAAIKEAQDLVDSGVRKSVEDAISYREDLRVAIDNANATINKSDENLNKLGLSRAKLTQTQDEMTEGGKKYVKVTETETKSTKSNTDAQDKLNEALEAQKKLREDLLEVIKDRLDREKTAQEELDTLNLNRVEEEIEGMGKVLRERTKNEEAIAKLQLDYDKFEEDLIQGAIERQIEAKDEEFINGTMSEQEYIKAIEKIRTDGSNNLLEIEKTLLERKKELNKEEEDEIKKLEEQKRVTALNSRELLEVEIAKLTNDFRKEQEIREVQNSKMTEEEKTDEILRIRQEYYEQDKLLLQQIEDEKLDILDESERKELDNINLTAEERLEVQKKYEKQRVELSQETQNAINKIEDEGLINFTQTTEERVNELATKVGEYLTTYGDMFMDLFGGINDLLNQLNENRLNAISQQNEIELANIQRQFDSRAISEEEYNALVIQQQNKADEQSKSLKRKQFQREKSYNIANAIMQGAIAVLNGLSTAPLVPLGLIMAGVAAALTGVQIATISQQQFTAARGGIVPGNGLPGDVDSVNAKLAPGEAVINSRSTAMFPQALSFINQAGGGVPLIPESVQQGSSGSGVIFMENQQQPLKAYVVETEITDSQKRVNRIERSVEF